MQIYIVARVWDAKSMRARGVCDWKEKLERGDGLVLWHGAVAAAEDEVAIAEDDIDRAGEIRGRGNDAAQREELAEGVGLELGELLLQDCGAVSARITRWQ